MLKELVSTALDNIAPSLVAGAIPVDIRQLIANEANAIDNTMRDLDVFAWTVDSEIVVSGIGGFIRYTIETGPGVKAGSVKAIREDIEIAVNRVRQKLLGGEYIDLSWNRGLSFDLPYPGKRKLLHWNAVPETKSLQPMQMVAGRDYSGFKPFTRMLSFGGGETTHIFVGGGTGSGKSVAVCGLVASLCTGTSPDVLQVIVVDIKRCKDLALVASFPHVTMHHEPEEAKEILESVYAEMRRRQAGGDESAKIVLVIEEMSELIALAGKDAVMRILNGLAKTARSAGIHMIACTQYPNSKTLDREFMVNFDVKLCGAFSSKQAVRQALDVEDFTGSLLPGKGSFYMNSTGNIARIQTSALFADRLLDVVATVRKKWENVTPWRMSVEVDSTQATERSDSEMITQILNTYELSDIFDTDGNIIRGMRANILELLFGDRTDKNKPSRTLNRLLEQLK